MKARASHSPTGRQCSHRVAGHRDEHGAHPEVEPAGVVEHRHAGVHQRPAGAAADEGVEVGRVPAVLARRRPQAVVAAVEVAELQLGLALELLDEVAVPVQAADEGGQARPPAVGFGGGRPAADGWPEPLRAGRGSPARDKETAASRRWAPTGATRCRPGTGRCARAGRRGAPPARRCAHPAGGGAARRGQPEGVGGGGGASGQGRGEADGLRRRQAGLGNEGFPALVPGVAVGEPADHPELGELLPLHAPAAAPAAHRDVALEARPVAGLLVGIQRVEGLGRWRRSNTSTASPVSTCSRPPSSRRAGTGRAGSRAGSRSAGARRRGRPTGWARRCRRTAAARAGRR
jgi:hypothetical protein